MLKSVFFGAIGAAIVTVGALIFVLPTQQTDADTPETRPGTDGSVKVSEAETTTEQSDVQLSERFAAMDDNSFVVSNARIFDGHQMITGSNIIVRDGIITGVGADIDASGDLQVIEATGLTVLPGLIDAHTHSWGAALSDTVNFGVTVNLDMFTAASMLEGEIIHRDTIERTDKADLFSSGTLATVPGGHGTQFGIPIETLTKPDEADAWVAARLAEGSDYIKIVYIPYQSRIPSLDRPTAKALIAAAHARDMLVVAHIGTMQGAEDLAHDGIDGFVHVFADKAVTPDFIDLALQKKIFIIPTLSILASVDGAANGPALVDDTAIGPWLSNGQVQTLSATFPGGIPGFSIDLGKANIRALHAAGVPIYAGSDAPNPGTAHGASLHQELELLVESGLSPREALVSATAGPADAFGLKDRGQIAVGYRADLLFVQGDPQTDIKATRNIEQIIKNGFGVERAQRSQAGQDRWTQANLGDFENDLAVTDNIVWAATSDEFVGGKSTANVSQVEGGAQINTKTSTGAMHVIATVNPGFFFPWAGTMLAFSPDFAKGYDISSFDGVTFDVRGTPGKYRAMLFIAGSAGAPPTAIFEVKENWATVNLDFSEFRGLNAKTVTAFALVAGPAPGRFEYDIDNVRFASK